MDDRGEAFKKILEASLNKILQTESAEQLKAAPYERSDERTDIRNGSRDRNLKTRVGRFSMQVPRHRNVPFMTLVFDNDSRSEAALAASMAEMVVNRVSTRKVSRVMETLCKELDKAVKEFRTRPSEGGLSVSYGGCYIDDYRDVAGWNRYNRETLFYTLESVGSIPPLVLSFS